MASNPLLEVQKYGQSIWYDNISRDMLTSGEFQRMIEEDGILGMTSNPTIFEKAIAHSTCYDEALHRLVAEGKDTPQIYEALVIEDIRMAADILRPVYERTAGLDGYVSVEVLPGLAYSTESTISEARRLWQTIARENLMIKVPATMEGLPAVERLIGEGVNVNVTLIFSLEMYRMVMEAYLSGLERLTAAGRSPVGVASVASFFVSRIDTAVDKILHDRLAATQNAEEAGKLRALLGKAAVANAKVACSLFKATFGGPRFAALRQRGARVQRPLWASTSTKNPAYRDVVYVEELIGSDTVNTVPPATIAAFKDHGVARPTLEEGLDRAVEVLRGLEQLSINMEEVTGKLLADGVKAFSDSHTSLLASISDRQATARGNLLRAQYAMGGPGIALDRESLGPQRADVDVALGGLDRAGAVGRLWGKDASLWKPDEQPQRAIKNRLGWLTVAESMGEKAGEIAAFAQEVRRAGFTHALLLGMGGSSLCPEVCRATFGVKPGYLDLAVLDTTAPAAVLRMERRADPLKTLFVVSTKSGTTTETASFYKYFYEKVRALKGERAGENFVAITDPGSPLEKLAQERGFRRLFPGMPDVGGRYSALSHFGLVPMALIGVDLPKLLARAGEMARRCGAKAPTVGNPAFRLGAVLGEMARSGRDKLTFILAPALKSFGCWAEQLVAESTGKEGRGILPVDGEPLSGPGSYGRDRLFVYLRLPGDALLDAQVRALEEAGHPVVVLNLRDKYDLGGEFFRWEMATAVASALLGVNPFDEPNVTESKDNTSRLLKDFAPGEALPEEEAVSAHDAGRLPAALKELSGQARPGDYLALLAYLPPTPQTDEALREIRLRLRDALRLATTVGYGPRYLHSTGQLHKGGAGNGLFIQLTADDREDAAIPGEPYTFGVLKKAQALGDLQALRSRRRRVLAVNLGDDVAAGLGQLLSLCPKS